MRLGKIKNIIDAVIDDDAEIVINHSPIYGGQAEIVEDFGKLVEALEILSNQNWNDVDHTEVKAILDKYDADLKKVQMEAGEFAKLNSYISDVNKKLPFYYSILEAMVEKQDERTINIKLPAKNIESLKDLAALNNRLDKILKQFNVNGQFEFRGFDKGSDWYIVTTVGPLSYAFILACLKLAKDFLETREAYFKSETARLDYLASLKKSEEANEKDQKAFSEKRKMIELEEGVKKAVDEIGVEGSGYAKEQIKNQLIKATKALLEELEKGTELHLSLNPPAYAEPLDGDFNIDYAKVREIVTPKNEPKSIAPTTPMNNESEDDDSKEGDE